MIAFWVILMAVAKVKTKTGLPANHTLDTHTCICFQISMSVSNIISWQALDPLARPGRVQWATDAQIGGWRDNWLAAAKRS